MEVKASDPGNMAVRFDDIGNRLKAFRLGSGLSADEIASRLGISRTALYRFEKGELAKIETLEKLAELLSVSVPTLLGVGVEYIASAVSYFERMRQIEETCEHIIVLAGPISYDGLLIQCAGRVIRRAPGKETAEVHDYHDPAVPIVAVSLPRRMPGYRALGFTRT